MLDIIISLEVLTYHGFWLFNDLFRIILTVLSLFRAGESERTPLAGTDRVFHSWINLVCKILTDLWLLRSRAAIDQEWVTLVNRKLGEVLRV